MGPFEGSKAREVLINDEYSFGTIVERYGLEDTYITFFTMKHILTGILIGLMPLSAALAQSEYDKQARQILDAMSEHYQAIGAYEADFSYSMEIPDQPQSRQILRGKLP